MLSYKPKDKDHKPLLTIKDNNDKNVGQIYHYEKAKDDVNDGFLDLELEDDYKFHHISNQNNERDVLFVSGMAGSGKSYYVNEYSKEYHSIHPKRPIYLFSFKREDKTLDSNKTIKRINIFDAEFLDEEIGVEDFRDSLVIFDDIECISEKKLKTKIFKLLTELLQIGRSYNVSICFANHEPTNSQETKPILTESQSITIFPKNMGNKKLQYLLDSYFGMDKEQIAK